MASTCGKATSTGQLRRALFREISDYMPRTIRRRPSSCAKNFDEAVHDFADGSIDLPAHRRHPHLRRPSRTTSTRGSRRCRRRGVVLFHDVKRERGEHGACRARKFGVRRFFDSVKDRYPHFDFDHCWGLGVLVVGPQAPAEVMELVAMSRDPAFAAHFAAKGAVGLEAFRRHGRGAAAAWQPTGRGRAALGQTRQQGASGSSTGRSAWARKSRMNDRCQRAGDVLSPSSTRFPRTTRVGGRASPTGTREEGAPQFRRHDQPRVPRGRELLRQSRKETLAWQIDLARRSRPVRVLPLPLLASTASELLETPPNLGHGVGRKGNSTSRSASPGPTRPGSRRWDGRDHHICRSRRHRPDPAVWKAHFEYLSRVSDERAVRVDGKPVFLVYRAAPHHPDRPDVRPVARGGASRRGIPAALPRGDEAVRVPGPRGAEALRRDHAVPALRVDLLAWIFEKARHLGRSQPRAGPVRMCRTRCRTPCAPSATASSRPDFYDYDMVGSTSSRWSGTGAFPRSRARSSTGTTPPGTGTARASSRALAGALRLLVPPARRGHPRGGPSGAPDLPERLDEWAESTYSSRRAPRDKVPRSRARRAAATNGAAEAVAEDLAAD